MDTGRLFNETYSVLNSTLERYKTPIKVYYPQTDAVEKLVSEKGPISFYESLENRKECCYIRKVEPLKRALKGKSIWITGIRAEQSDNRQDMPNLEWDEANQIIKFHPILNWTLEEVKAYIFKGELITEPSIEEKISIIKTHLQKSIEWKGKTLGILEMRPHYSNYLKGLPNIKPYRARLVTTLDEAELYSILDEVLNEYSGIERKSKGGL